MKRTVWEQGSMSSTLEDTPPPELIEHTETVYLGTPGGLQYRHITRSIAGEPHFSLGRPAGYFAEGVGK